MICEDACISSRSVPVFGSLVAPHAYVRMPIAAQLLLDTSIRVSPAS